MKILTLNCHTTTECDSKKQMAAIVDVIVSEKITSFCLQEVKQERTGRIVDHSVLKKLSFIEAQEGEVQIRESNFAFLLQKELRKVKSNFSWTWADSYEEDEANIGLAIFSKISFSAVKTKMLTRDLVHKGRCKRRSVAVCLENSQVLVNVHFSEQYNQFLLEWGNLIKWIKEIKKENVLFVMGDFNIDAESNRIGYKKLCESFQDTYMAALSRGDGLTVRGAVKGWQDSKIGKRIDYILAQPAQSIISSRIYFEGDLTPRISSHAGVVIETDDVHCNEGFANAASMSMWN